MFLGIGVCCICIANRKERKKIYPLNAASNFFCRVIVPFVHSFWFVELEIPNNIRFLSASIARWLLATSYQAMESSQGLIVLYSWVQRAKSYDFNESIERESKQFYNQRTLEEKYVVWNFIIFISFSFQVFTHIWGKSIEIDGISSFRPMYRLLLMLGLETCQSR